MKKPYALYLRWGIDVIIIIICHLYEKYLKLYNYLKKPCFYCFSYSVVAIFGTCNAVSREKRFVLNFLR